MRPFLFLVAVLLTGMPLGMSAQKKTIQQAQQLIKTGKELEKAEKLMTGLLKDSNNITNTKIHLTLFEAVKKQYEQGNEKLYLKQKYDTTALFNNTLKMFTVIEHLDSIESQKEKPSKRYGKWRERHVAYLNSIRPNLLNGGHFFSNKQQYEKAATFFNHYLNTATHPLYTQYNYADNDSLMPRAAYGAMYCAFKLNQPEEVLKHSALAAKIPRNKEYVYQFKAEAYNQLKDTVNYFNTLKQGFNINPHFTYFFPRIVDHYINCQQTDSAMTFVNQALRIDSLNPSFRFAQSTLLLNTGKYSQCIDICEDLIAEDDDFIEAYYNIGLAYFDEAIRLDKKMQRDKKTRDTITQLYRKSLPFMLRVREEQPKQQQKWAKVLYTIYLNLNMGDEFDEINRLITTKNQLTK